MKTLAIVSAVYFFFAFVQPSSKVVWLGPSEVELNEVRHHDYAMVSFPFRNVSDQPLTIDNIRTSCGCTAPDWSDVPLMPGDTASVVIRYDAEKTGVFKQWIRVYLRGQRQPERLWIKGEVVQ